MGGEKHKTIAVIWESEKDSWESAHWSSWIESDESDKCQSHCEYIKYYYAVTTT